MNDPTKIANQDFTLWREYGIRIDDLRRYAKEIIRLCDNSDAAEMSRLKLERSTMPVKRYSMKGDLLELDHDDAPGVILD